VGDSSPGVQQVHGNLTIDGGVIDIDDSGDSVGRNCTLDSVGHVTTLTGMSPAPIAWNNSYVVSESITGGGGGDSINVHGTNCALAIDAGHGNDTFNVSGAI